MKDIQVVYSVSGMEIKIKNYFSLTAHSLTLTPVTEEFITSLDSYVSVYFFNKYYSTTLNFDVLPLVEIDHVTR